MVVDPRFYEKHSGRKGDPYDRLGQALASSDKRKHEREETMHKLEMASSVPRDWRIFFLEPKVAIGLVIVVAIIGLVLMFKK